MAAWKPYQAPTPTWTPQVRPGGAWAPAQPRPTAVAAVPGQWQAAPIAVKRPVLPGAVGAVPAGGETYVVSSKAKDEEEVVVKTLIGEYVENGSNHGRKFFKKQPDNKGGEAVDVFLYYWDGRDGPAFEGWWFGNKLGGTQVWSHCTGGSLTPPSTGWKIPWDGAVRPTLCVDNKVLQQRAQASDKLTSASAAIAEVGVAAKKALDEAKDAHGGAYTSVEGIQAAEELLQPHPLALSEALKKLMEAQRGAVGEVAKQLMQLGTMIRTSQGQVNAELVKLRGGRLKAEQTQKQKVFDEKDAVALQEVMPEATQKTNLAEDAVEKAVITAEMIEAGGEDLEEVRQAVAQTEQAAQDAQKAIGEARIYLNAKQASCRRFESEAVKLKAATELGKLQALLQTAQNKLNPLKTARQDFVQRMAAQKLTQEVLERLSPAEVDVDRAEEATVMLAGESMTKEMMQQAEQAVSKAGDHVNAVLKFIAQKKATAAGVAREEVAKLEERAKASQQRLAQLKSQHRESAEKVLCESLLQEAAEKLHSVADSVAKAANAEGPFLMGVEDLPLDETLAAVKACETAATSANTAVSIARMFIATKVVEAKRFTSKCSQEAIGKLKDLQKELDNDTKRLADLKGNTSGRKKKALMRETESQVADAEAATKAMAEVAAVFEDDVKLAELSQADIRRAAEETQKAEAAATAKLNEARKYIHARQIEAKGKDASAEDGAELIKYNTRISTALAEVTKYKKLVGSIGERRERLEALRTIEEAKTKIASVEEKVNSAHEMAAALEGEDKGPEAVKEAETATAECQVALRQLSVHLKSVANRRSDAKSEIAKLQPRLQAAQEKLETALTSMRGRAEQVEVKKILAESEQKMVDAEDAVKSAFEAEAPFVKNEEEALDAEAATKAFEELDKAAQAAHTAVGSARTFIAMKRLATKRLAEVASATGAEGLNKLQERLDTATKKLQEIKATMAKRKHETVKREVAAKLTDTEQLLQAVRDATTALVEGGDDLAPDAMKAACEKVGTTQHAAREAINSSRQFLAQKQKEARSNSSVDSSIVAELTKMMEDVDKAQAELDAQKRCLRDQEHKFVARRLMKDATDMVEALEKKLAATTETAAPLASDQKEDFTAAIYLAKIIEALRQHMTSKEKTSEELFAEMSEKAETMAEGNFVSFLSKLPELSEQEAALFSAEELKAAFRCIDASGSAVLVKEQFLDQFKQRHIVTAVVAMTDSLAIKGGKTVRKLEVNEVIEALEEPAKDARLGLLRMKARAEKDGKEGYITLRGNQGTDYLAAYDPYLACEKRVERTIQDLLDEANATQKYVEKKTDELKGVDKGPLGETKKALLELKPRISKVQQAQAQLKGKVAEARKSHQAAVETEKRRLQEAVDRRAAKAMMDEAESEAKAAEEEADQAIAAAEALVSSKGADAESPPDEIGRTEKALGGAAEACDRVEGKIKAHLDGVKAATKGPYAEARSALKQLRAKVSSCASNCKKQIAAVQAMMKQLEGDAHEAIVNALTAHVRKEGLTAEAVFVQLSKGESVIPVESFKDFVEKIPGLELKRSQLGLGLHRYVAGVAKLTIFGLLQQYLKCVKDIAITTNFEVKDSKTLRKISAGETVEVLEPGKVDEPTGCERCRCRALCDAKEGWATLRGNQGTAFMERCAKPYYCCEEEAELQAGFESTSAEVCRVQPGEVLEVLEGPRQEEPLETLRVKGKAAKDGKVGWVTLRDVQGRERLQLAKLLVCNLSIAITTTFDIAEGKALRKLDAGEALEILEGPKEDPVRSLTRVRARAKSDGKEGWVTLKGNQGTSYAEETETLYICKMSVPLERRFPTGSDSLRTLEVDEVFEVTDGPKPETKEGAKRVKGRNLSDGSEGWFTLAGKSFQEWAPQYTCVQSTVINDSLCIKEAKAVRKLEVGESLEALETPVLEKTAGLLRIRVRAEKDGATGFATVRGNQGTVMLKPVLGGGEP